MTLFRAVAMRLVSACMLGATSVASVMAAPYDPFRDISREASAPSAALDRALALLNDGALAQAEQAARELVQLQPDSAPAHEILGAALALQGRYDAALPALRRAVDVDPDQATAWTKIGDVAAALERPEAELIGYYMRALKADPRERLAHQRLGLIAFGRGEMARAADHLRQGLSGAPEDYLGVRAELAAALLALDQPQAALETLARWESRAARGGSVEAGALLTLGAAHMALERPELAAERFAAAHAARPADALSGLMRLGLGSEEARAAALARLGALDDPSAVAARAALIGASGAYDAALAELDAALRAAPEHPGLLRAKAVALSRKGEPAAAAEAAQALVAAAPASAEAAFLLGMLRAENGEPDRAAEAYRAALAQDEAHWPSLNNLAMLRLEAGALDEALSLAERAAASGAPEALETLARVRAQME